MHLLRLYRSIICHKLLCNISLVMYTGIKQKLGNYVRVWCANVIFMVKYVEYYNVWI